MDTLSLLASLAAAAEQDGRATYLVGGCVRDLLLQRPVKDFDVALDGEALSWARQVATQTGGSFVPLDEERDIARLVFKDERGAPSLQVDVVPLGETIEQNLAQRDFTINAMALPLGQWSMVKSDAERPRQWFMETLTINHQPLTINHRLVDPFGGLSDLRARLIRVVRPEAFTDDPLRLLRAVRFAARLGFDIEEETWRGVCQHAPLLARVAAERIREEFFAVLAADSCVPYLRLMCDAGLLDVVLPELSTQTDAVERGLRTVESVERLLTSGMEVWKYGSMGVKDLSPPHAHTPIPLYRIPLLKLAALLCPVVSSEAAEEIAQRLRFSNQQAHLLALILCYHDEPRRLVASDSVTGRARRRFFRAVGDAAVEVLLLSLAVQHEPDAALTNLISAMLRDYLDGAPPARPTRFVRGDEIMARYGISAGPRIRELLEAVEEAEAEDAVRNRDDAWRLLDDLAKQGV